MGASTAFAAAVAGNPRVLLRDGNPDPAAAEALISEWLPGTWVPGEATTLESGLAPRNEMTALRIPGLDIVGGDAVLNWIERPLPPRVVQAVGSRRLVIHQMHSANDSMGFGVWQSGSLIRALGMDPENGIFINQGEPTAAEEPFWRGDHPEDDGYPLPFHPLELAEELLRAELGFVFEGMPQPDDVEPWDVPMFTFTLGAATRNIRSLFRRR